MIIELLPELTNFIYWSFIVCIVMGGLVAAAVALSASFRKVMNP